MSMDSAPPAERRIHRTLTQKYDMHQIRDLQALEDEIRVDLAVIYSLDDPDDVTVDIDFLHLYNNLNPSKEESIEEQKAFLRSVLHDAPLPTEEIILKILEKVTEVKLKYTPKKDDTQDINLQDIIK